MTEPTAKSSSATGANGLKFIVLGERRLFAALIAENDSRERTCQLVLEIEFHGERPAIWPANRDGDWFLTNLRLEDLKSSPLTISKLAAQSEPWSCFISDVAIAPPSVRSDAPTPAAPIVENVGFRVLRVVYFRPMIETIAPPASPLSLCLLFGRDDEAHLIHLRFRRRLS